MKWMSVRRGLPVAGLLLLFGLIILQRAWLCDDAFITFRTVDNFIHGYGLTWNSGERVQVFTHPLWLGLVSIFYAVTHEAFFTGIFLSLAVSLLAATLFAFRIAPTRLTAAVGIVIFSLSNAYVDYSTSGLENPLTHLLLTIFIFLYLYRETSLRILFCLSLVAGLIAVNRLDVLLACLPALGVAFWQVRGKRMAWLALAGGLLPLFFWEAFSLIYYGFPFPNTAYAKLNTGIGAFDLILQGFKYLKDSLVTDPITLVAIISGLIVGILRQDRRRMFPMVVGVLFYLGYLVRIGGDFMSGRFLAAPLLLSVSLLVNSHWILRQSQRPRWLLGGAAVLGLLAYVPTFMINPIEMKPLINPDGIANERLFYFRDASLVYKPVGVEFPRGKWVDEGRMLRSESLAGKDPMVVFDSIGFRGYFAGPSAHIVDILGLADPLLARLPPVSDPKWRIGHLSRSLPAGYLESLQSGENRIEDKKLGEYYVHLARITQGRFFDPTRLQDIWKMNTGQYNGLIDQSAYRFPGR
jgi:arabinofuranosyltransferase